MHGRALEVAFPLDRSVVLSGGSCELDADKLNALLARYIDLANVSDRPAVGDGLGFLESDLHDLASFQIQSWSHDCG